MSMGNTGKAESTRFNGKRTLFLIPYVTDVRQEAELTALVTDYWREAVEQVERLAAAIAPVRHLFHEGSLGDGNEARAVLEHGNVPGYPFLKRLLDAGAVLEPTEDVEALKETLDLHRCMAVVQASHRVADRLMEWFEQTRKERYQAIAQKVNAALRTGGSGVLVISPDHQVQFAQDIEVVYVAPPALDRVTRWMRDHPVTAQEPGSSAAGGSANADDDAPTWAKQEPGA